MFAFLSHFAGDTVGSAMLLSLVIILCASVLEDLTIIVVGVLAADDIISVPIAFLSVYLGIILGDSLLYALGAFARSHPRLAHYIDHDFTAPFRTWLGNRYAFHISLIFYQPYLLNGEPGYLTSCPRKSIRKPSIVFSFT